MNTRSRIIPTLLLQDKSLVKTVQFKEVNYIGDPINTVRIFNELEVDELVFLDINASKNGQAPEFKYLENIASECFMPLAYGGGIRSLDDAKKIFQIGFEKVILNSSLYTDPDLVTRIADLYGSQAVVVSLDYRKNLFSGYSLYSHSGKKKESFDLFKWAHKLQTLGAGELLLTCIDQEGTWDGYDLKTIRKMTDLLHIPVVANGGAGSLLHLHDALKIGQASALGVGSLVVFQKKGMGVLINFPDKSKLNEVVFK